jgi:hypothetical protein
MTRSLEMAKLAYPFMNLRTNVRISNALVLHHKIGRRQSFSPITVGPKVECGTVAQAGFYAANGCCATEVERVKPQSK